jgi:hypothetical protein
MKIKRFNNLWLMGLILSASILGVVYIIKLFFPQFVIEVAEFESITRIGHYIDNHKWAWYLFSIVISFITCYLTCCASCRRSKLNNKEIVILLATILILYAVREFLPMQFTVLNYASLIVLPCIFKGDFKATAICFTSINLLQTMTLEIRNLSSMIVNFNFASSLILLIDVYIFQVLLYFLFNYKKEE